MVVKRLILTKTYQLNQVINEISTDAAESVVWCWLKLYPTNYSHNVHMTMATAICTPIKKNSASTMPSISSTVYKKSLPLQVSPPYHHPQHPLLPKEDEETAGEGIKTEHVA